MKTSVTDILYFRLKQNYRALKDLGIGLLLLLSPILVMGILGLLHDIAYNPGSFLNALLPISILWGIHFTRKDAFFIRQTGVNFRLYICIEYLMLVLPFGLTYIYYTRWYCIALLGIGILLLLFIPPSFLPKTNSKQSLSFRWIPLEIFEWRAGLRKSGSTFLVLYILGLALSFYTITVPIVIASMGLLITSFFQLYENKDLLLSVNHNGRFLSTKVRKSLLLFNLLLLPHYLLYLLFSWEYWFVLPIIAVIANMIIAFAICMKYRSYRFDQHKVGNGMPLGIFIACWCYPFLWPIPIIMLIIFWRQAQQNLIRHYA